jgi:predicted RNase H-like HicB family nuclease
MEPQFTIIYERDEKAGWIATIPEVPGAFSEGRTKRLARENVIDALKELMAARRDLAVRRRSPASVVEELSLTG